LFDEAFTEEFKRRIEICGYGWNDAEEEEKDSDPLDKLNFK